ncbi:MAG TPA: hypothetical protein VNW04_22485 [Puia sp.]|jgi:hypothetical protein|nr:hypothetical protein [Puia sp.]
MIGVTLLLIAAIGFLARCVHTPAAPADPRGEAFASGSSCISCHKDIANSYFHTAHALTSRAADSSSIRGSFEAPGNLFSYGAHGMVRLEKRDSGFYQLAFRGDRTEAHRFDIVIGSGRKAQTYLYWEKDRIYQLPVSYFVTAKTWANSPDFPTDSIWFGRSIATECFECHSSFVQHKQPGNNNAFHPVEFFGRSSLIYGIDCQRCHGPAAQHVDWHTRHPEEKQPRFMVRFDTLKRQQRLDACAVCHSGIHPEQLSLFRFRPGHRLANYYFAEPTRYYDTSTMDVHGNQYQLLLTSKCFQNSTLDCITCHNPHRTERDSLTVFTQRCQSCHNPLPPHPGMDPALLLAKCIDCHMPARPSKVITLQTAAGQKPIADLIRTHRIAIYR